MKKIKIKKKFSGFTLMELMVVIAIVGIMTGIGTVSFSSARRATALNSAQDEIISAIKLAQSYALQGKTYGSNQKPDGYGFEFTDNNSYKIFRYEGVNKEKVDVGDLKGVEIKSPAFSGTEVKFNGDYAEVSCNGSPCNLTIELKPVGATSPIKKVVVTKNGFVKPE